MPALPTYFSFDQQRREQLPLDAEVPLLGVRRLARVAVTDYTRVCGVEFRRCLGLDRHDRRKRVVDGPQNAHVERVGLGLHVLRDRERHVQVIQVAGGVRTGEIGDAEPRPQHRPHVVGQPVGHAEPGREVVEPRLLVGTARCAVFASVDQDESLEVEVAHPVIVLGGLMVDFVPKTRVDREAAVDLEIVLDERRLLHDVEVRYIEQESA